MGFDQSRIVGVELSSVSLPLPNIRRRMAHEILEGRFGGFDDCLQICEDEMRVGVNDSYTYIVIVMMLLISFQPSFGTTN